MKRAPLWRPFFALCYLALFAAHRRYIPYRAPQNHTMKSHRLLLLPKLLEPHTILPRLFVVATLDNDAVQLRGPCGKGKLWRSTSLL